MLAKAYITLFKVIKPDGNFVDKLKILKFACSKSTFWLYGLWILSTKP